MPLGSYGLRCGRFAYPGSMVLAATAWLSCSAPDGSGLFQPFGAGGSAGVPASGGGGAGGEPDASNGGTGGTSGSLGGTSGADGEGQGGNLPLAGASGLGGSSVASQDDGPLPDGGAPDAGVEPDAGIDGPPPDACDPSDEICDGLDNDCDDIVDSAGACPDGCTGFVLSDHAYMLCNELVDRGIALARCGGEDMKLAWIETPGENAALVAALRTIGVAADGEVVVQIGASDEGDEDEWFWIGNAAAFDGFQFWEGNAAEAGGETVGGAYANWGSGEPNNSNGEDCGALSISGSGARQPGQWDDRPCASEIPFLCEQP